MSKAGSGETAQPAAASASTLILLQVSARALTFVLNQLLVRLVSPSIFGLANIQLELLLSTILFLSRDGIRTILIRNEPVSSQDNAMKGSANSATTEQIGPRKGTSNSVHNVALLPIPIGFLFTAVACSVYAVYISPSAMHAVPTFYISIALYAVGALAELLYEPLLIRAVRLGQPALRVKAEGAAVFVKVISNIATILVLPRFATPVPTSLRSIIVDEKAIALLAFGIGQASFGLTMLSVHLLHFITRYSLASTLDLYIPRPDRITTTEKKTKTVWLDGPTLSLCFAMSQQGILKHALTEADKFAVAKYATLEDQGGYALASNYGSLVARILFQPVEETARIVFSSELQAIDPDDNKTNTSRAQKSRVSKATLERVSSMLAALFRVHFLLGCLMVTFGGPFSRAFLYIMAGPQWALGTSAPEILLAYTFYLPIMGINGIVEGFVQSVASKKQVGRYSRILLLASAGFVAVLASINAFVARGSGGSGEEGGTSFLAKTGLVWANALSLAVRAGWCWSFVIRYFGLAAAISGTPSDAKAEVVSRIRPSSGLPCRPTLFVFSSIAVLLRIVVPRVMPSTAALLQASATKGATLAAGRAVKLEAIRSLVPTLGLAGLSLSVVLGSIALFERRVLVASLRALSRKRASGEGETRKTQ